MDNRIWFALTVLAALAAADDHEGEGPTAGAQVTCYDCWYQEAAHKIFDDDVCNPNNSVVDKGKVSNETCDGMCYTTFSTFTGLYVKRGCMEKDEECVTGEIQIAKIGWGNRTCCDTDFCNGEFIEGAAINIQASALITSLFASAILFYHTAL